MFRDPRTMDDARDMGVPECFSEEYAFHERQGTLPPYAGPVYPDTGIDYDYSDPDPDPDPAPCQGPPPMHAFLGLPAPWHPHEPWCWDHHAPDGDGCPPF